LEQRLSLADFRSSSRGAGRARDPLGVVEEHEYAPPAYRG
jgi:hypothetical protein